MYKKEFFYSCNKLQYLLGTFFLSAIINPEQIAANTSRFPSVLATVQGDFGGTRIAIAAGWQLAQTLRFFRRPTAEAWPRAKARTVRDVAPITTNLLTKQINPISGRQQLSFLDAEP